MSKPLIARTVPRLSAHVGVDLDANDDVIGPWVELQLPSGTQRG